jgi:sigma-B regulation protein RsbU (phosphoserine phosphatase)
LLYEMLARVRELLETDCASILLLAEDERSLVLRATIGLEGDELGLRIPAGKGVTGAIAASRAPMMIEDLSIVDVIYPSLRRNAKSLIGPP